MSHSLTKLIAEDPDVKKTVKDIIDKWTRIITESANDYEVSHEDLVSALREFRN